jgi:hypothetical protein
MPKRTNDYQKLVKIISQHFASEKSKITESAMLDELDSGSKREIDILVELSEAGHDIKIGIECNASNSPMRINDVQALHTKHLNVGINATVIVAKNGFSAPALKYCEKRYIKALKFDSALKERWSESFIKLRDLSFYARNYTVHKISISVANPVIARDFCFDRENKVMYDGKWMLLTEFAAELLKMSDVPKKYFSDIKKNEEHGTDPWLEIGFDLHGSVLFMDKNKTIINPIGIMIVYKYVTNYRSFNTKPVTCDGKEIVIGAHFDKNLDEAAHAVFSLKNGRLAGSMEITGKLFPLFKDRK